MVAVQDALFSAQWYRVAALKPRMRSNVVTHRHYYRGAVWYVVGAKTNKSHLRINASAYYLFTQFDGERPVEAVWQSALSVLKDDAPSQDEVLRLLHALFDAAVIDFQSEADVDQLFDDQLRKEARETRSRYWNPLFLRFALFDPNRLAARLLRLSGWAFTRAAFNAWLLLVASSVVAAAYAWPDLKDELAANLASRATPLLVFLVFPVMKLLHELGHAVATKRWGGDVNELGVALVVLMPIPYVDASDSASFSGKYRRMAVAAAGIVVETTLACFALYAWLLVDPGLVRDIAFTVLLTGTVSSVLFNANPLLKFDGYYVLSDAIEIPNLASRSNRYLLYLVKRYLLGLRQTSPVTARGERRWFIGYGVLSMVYRASLTVAICLFVATKYFFIGIGIAIWALVAQVGVPVARGFKFLLTDPRLGDRRVRANAAAAGCALAIAAALLFVPLSNATHARGVVWPVDDAVIRARADCFVEELLVANGAYVDVGTELVRCDTALLEAEAANLRAEQLAARAAVYAAKDRAERAIEQSELDKVGELLANAEQKLRKATLVSSTRGIFFAPEATNIVGNYFAQGEVIAYVLDEGNLSIRTMLAQERAALVGDRLGSVEVRLLRTPGAVRRSTIVRRVPAATHTLVTAALGIDASGDLALDSDDADGVRLERAAFEIELELPPDFRRSLVGEAVEVRFDHGTASAADLLYRQLRLLFLRRFGV